MSLLKRFVTTVHSSVDRTLATIENHEAVVDAALKESRQAVAQARVRLGRLEKEAANQRNRVAELSSEIELWNERARSVAQQDREKALSCIQRRQQREREMEVATKQLVEQDRVIAKVRRSVDESGERVLALQNQRDQMRSREAASRAGQIVQSLNGKVDNDVDAAIERWEVSVGAAEMLNDSLDVQYPETDELADAFSSVEQHQQLEAELDQLLAGGSKNND